MANHPIFHPTFHGDLAKVKTLLKKDPELINIRDAKGLTPLHVASSRGMHRVIHLLVEKGADVTGSNSADIWPPLVFACYRGHLQAAQALIECGAGTTEEHGNPIHFAGQRKHREICRLLVKSGAIDDLIPSGNPSALKLFRHAYSYEHEKVERILRAEPELVHLRDCHLRTPLHEACTHGDIRTVRVLLKFGVDLKAKDDRGQTAADRATAHRQHSIVKALAKAAAAE